MHKRTCSARALEQPLPWTDVSVKAKKERAKCDPKVCSAGWSKPDFGRLNVLCSKTRPDYEVLFAHGFTTNSVFERETHEVSANLYSTELYAKSDAESIEKISFNARGLRDNSTLDATVQDGIIQNSQEFCRCHRKFNLDDIKNICFYSTFFVLYDLFQTGLLVRRLSRRALVACTSGQ